MRNVGGGAMRVGGARACGSLQKMWSCLPWPGKYGLVRGSAVRGGTGITVCRLDRGQV